MGLINEGLAGDAFAHQHGEHDSASVGDFLQSQGMLLPADRVLIERAVERHLASAASGIRPEQMATIAPALDSGASTITLSTPVGHVLVEAIDHRAEGPSRYTLTRLHATGGLGQVWLARDARLGRDVAFKELRPECTQDPNLWSRFLKEARITGQLEHPGIVPIYELSEQPESGNPFYTMRFVRGQTLSGAIRDYHEKRKANQTGPLDRQALLTALLGVANAVAYAHSKGVIHRDLKGDNVVLGDFGEVILLDWGLAKHVREIQPAEQSQTSAAAEPAQNAAGAAENIDQTMRGHALGTPGYLPPEQAAGRLDEVDERSDVYGLGAILFDILTGRPPLSGMTLDETLERCIKGDLPRPRSIVADTPPALEAICLKALALRPQDRYPSASSFADEIRRFLADEPVAAYPEPLSKRAARWTRRNKQLVVGAGALLVTAVIALSIGTVLLRQKQAEIERQRGRAEQNFGMARAAVDRYFTRVSESPDLKALGMETLRRQLLETARSFYEKLAQQGANTPALRADLGDALLKLGDISRRLAEDDKSEDAYKRAIEIYDQLSRSEPSNTHYRAQFACALADSALLHADTGRTVDAEREYSRSIEVRRQVPTPAVSDADDLSGESITMENLGILYQNTGRNAQSEASYKQVLAIRQRLALDDPANDYRQDQLARIHLNLGVLYAQTNRLTEAETELSAAIPIAERLVEKQTDEPEYRNLLASSYGNLAGVYMLLNRLGDSRHAYRKEMTHRESLARTHPLVIEYVLFLGSGYTNLGELETRDHKPSDALPWFDRAIETIKLVLVREPNHAVARHYLSYTYSWRAKAFDAVGRYSDALRDCDAAIEFDDHNDPELRLQRNATALKVK